MTNRTNKCECQLNLNDCIILVHDRMSFFTYLDVLWSFGWGLRWSLDCWDFCLGDLRFWRKSHLWYLFRWGTAKWHLGTARLCADHHPRYLCLDRLLFLLIEFLGETLHCFSNAKSRSGLGIQFCTSMFFVRVRDIFDFG